MRFILTILIIMIASCNEKIERPSIAISGNEPQVEQASERSLTRFVKNETNAISIQATDTKQIKTAQLSLKVSSVDGLDAKLDPLLKKYEAYSTNTGTHGSYQRRNMTLTIRVKADQFDELLSDLEQLGEFTESKNVAMQDVTEQFIDIEARLKNKRLAEEQFLNILKKATSVRDILSVQNQLQQIRGEIESQEGRLKYLENQVNYSTISLSFYQILENEIEPTSGFLSRIGQSLSNGWASLLNSIIWLISLWPYAIIIAMLGFMYVKRK